MHKYALIALLVVALVATMAAAKDIHKIKPVRSEALKLEVTDDRGPGDFCTVGEEDALWAAGDFIMPPEEYVTFCDPAECDECWGGWLPTQVNMVLQFDEEAAATPYDVHAVIREADMTDPTCPVPGDVICLSSTYTVDVSGAGLYIVGLPLNMGCAVLDEPFFAGHVFESTFPEGPPDLVMGEDDSYCVSYNYYGGSWHDMSYDYGAYAVSLTADLECQEVAPDIDIKPGSCPNPMNVKSRGVLPVAILGTPEFDVTLVDPSTVMLADVVPPIRWAYEDVSSPMPFGSDPCDCNTDGPDGYDDMTLKFETQAVVTAIQPVDDGDEVSLTLTGELMDGTPFVFDDCVWILDKTKPQLRTERQAGIGSDPEARGSTESGSWGAIKALYR